MSDFLDRFGGQLLAAGQTLSETPAPRRARRIRVTRRGGAILGIAAVVVAGSALAATQPWEPSLGRPQLHDVPASVSASGVPSDQAALLGVLRRSQNATDRGPRTQQLLRHLGIEQTGVRTASIRALGSQAVLISVERAGAVPGASGEPGQSNPLCVLIDSGGFCGSAGSVRSGHFMVLSGDQAYGLVPDGVSRVVFDYPGGQSRSADVQDNFFALSGAPVTTRPVPPLRRSAAPLTIPQAPTVNWLDGDGRRVGPPSR
jgi:hypothetical protein